MPRVVICANDGTVIDTIDGEDLEGLDLSKPLAAAHLIEQLSRSLELAREYEETPWTPNTP